MNQTLLEAVREIPLFSELRADDLLTIIGTSALVHAPKGTLLFQEGETYRGFYVVVEGGVKIYKLTPDGKETMLHAIGRFQPLGEIPMFVGGGYPAHAETLSDSTLLLVHREGFLEQLRANPDLALRMLAGLAKRLKEMGAKLEKLMSLDVRTRLVRWLLDEVARQNPTSVEPVITLPGTKSLLAAQLGTVLETLSRTFRKLEAEGLVKVSGRRIHIRDLAALRNAGR